MKIPRMTRSIFLDQLIWMLAVGLIVGLMFPLFMILLGVPDEYVLTPTFYAASICAGVMMAGLNFGLVHIVIRPELKQLVQGMQKVRGALAQRLHSTASAKETGVCVRPEDCTVDVPSEDELGEMAHSFNQLVETLKQTQEVQQAYERFSKKLASSLSLQALAQQEEQLLKEFQIAQASAFYIFKDDELQYVSSYGIDHADRLQHHPLLKAVVDTLKPQHISLPVDLTVDAALVHFTPKEVYAEPVLFQGALVGILVLASNQKLDETQKAILHTMLNGLGLALRNALTHEEIQRIAALDSLTGIYNRRFGMERLHEEYTRVIRQDLPLSLLMMDIDHFKSINDTYGHRAGDRALKLVVKVMKSVMREGDILCRYGGEEFMAILPGADCDNAQEVAERIRRRISDTHLEHGDQIIPITISIGMASWPEHQVENEQQLIERADQTLYMAKESGRNRVVLAPV